MQEQKVEWPNRERVAASFSVVFELWSEGATPRDNMPSTFISGGVSLRPDVHDLRVIKMIEFGGKTGVWRLLNILNKEGVKGSFLVSGRAAEVFPEAVKAIHNSGHEVVAHGYAQDLGSYNFKDKEDERRMIRKTVEVIAGVTGEKPVGWLSPRATASQRTAEILSEEGFIYFSDYPDSEIPYILDLNGRKLVSVPYSGSAGVNDYHMDQGAPASHFTQSYKEIFDYVYEEGLENPGLVRASVHSHVLGRLLGAYAFRDIIRYTKSFPGVWIARKDEIARWWLKKYS